MKTSVHVLRIIILLVSLLAANTLLAATVTWSGVGADDNWSNPLNWAGGTPAGNTVFFTDEDATGVCGPFGVPNNIVDASVTMQSLRYGNTNGFHTTQIPAGSTLTVTGTGNTNIFVGTGTDNGGAQIVYATVMGQGTLLVTNSSANIQVIQGAGTATGAKATLDMEGLDTFIAYVNQIRIAAELGLSSTSPQFNRPNATLILAKTNVISTSANPGLLLSRTSSNGGPGVFRLGQTNAIFSNNGMTVGERKATSATRLDFNPNFVSPTALFRNLAGTGRQNQWIIGDDIGQNSGSTGANGTVDFTGGTVDAQINTILLGRGGAAPGTGVGTGTLTFDAGIVDVNTLDLGMLAGGAGVGTVNVNGTALLVVNNALRLTPNGGSASKATLNINGGIVWANSITNGGGLMADISLTSGTLVLTNEAGTLSSPVLNLTAGDGTIVLPVDPARTNIFVSNLLVTSTTNNTISILSLPAIQSYPAQYPLISYLAYYQLSAGDFLLGSTPPASTAYQGYISNNTATFTIDLVITGGPPPIRALTWRGTVNGDWNTSTTNWSYSGSATTYNQNDLVLFDDTVSGTTSVNLTTSLTPGSLTVNNNAKSYTFGGSGTLDGVAGLVKQGSGQLTLANSGLNTFAGPVSIEGGALQLSGSAERLPASSAVTLADVSGATLSLNNLNQTISALSGGGANGGNVMLGSGNLTITGDGGSHAAVISGSGSVIRDGAGTQVLAGANLYSGGTVISNGTLAIANPVGSGTGSGRVTVETNGTFQIGDGTQSGNVSAGFVTNNGVVRFNAANDISFSSVIVGDGVVDKEGVNVVTLPVANFYTNITTIDGGALRPTHPQALGTADAGTLIHNPPTARLELIGGITLAEPLVLNQKQSAAGNVPGILNVSGVNTLTGPIELVTGGSWWTVHSDAGKLVVSGPVTNTTTSNTRTLWLSGAGDGDWNSGLTDGAGGNPAAIRKDGTGTWTLAGTYTYTGSTVVSNGTLLVNGTITAGTVMVDGGTLGGNGSISVPVTVNSGGTLSPGTSIGKLSIYDSMTLAEGATTVMELSKSGATITNDQVSVLTTLAVGGTLNVTLSGTVTGGEVFTLFTAGTFQPGAAFSAINLPTLPGLTWDTSKLTVNGTLSVVGGAKPALGFTQSGNVLTFSWSEAGFRLLAQTNAAGIGTNWFYYPGGETSPVSVTVDPANPPVFFGLAP